MKYNGQFVVVLVVQDCTVSICSINSKPSTCKYFDEQIKTNVKTMAIA